jgi:hypothetical protein
VSHRVEASNRRELMDCGDRHVSTHLKKYTAAIVIVIVESDRPVMQHLVHAGSDNNGSLFVQNVAPYKFGKRADSQKRATSS